MREIKFRAKTIDGIWRYGFYYCSPLAKTHRLMEVVGSHRIIDHIIDEFTLGQYTGFEDMDNNNIYEGDYLSRPSDPKFPDLLVKWGPLGGWCAVSEEGNSFVMLPLFLRKSKIIGNIHDKKEKDDGESNKK